MEAFDEVSQWCSPVLHSCKQEESGLTVFLGPLIADRKKLGLSVQAFTEKVSEAIANGADVNDASRNNHRPLNLSLRYGYDEVVRLLIEAGADVNYKDRGGLDPIHIAINHGRYRLANLLIKSGARFSKRLPDLKYDYSKHYKFVYFHLGKGV